jgi:hypothetical protein
VRYFLDCEFLEAGFRQPVALVSIGIVAEDGREYYAESLSANLRSANSWVREHVIPKLHGPKKYPGVIAQDIKQFCGWPEEVPEFWGSYASYDWVVFCQIFGTMIDLPRGWPMYINDVCQLARELEVTLPEQVGEDAHHALVDARGVLVQYEILAGALRLRLLPKETLLGEQASEVPPGEDQAPETVRADTARGFTIPGLHVRLPRLRPDGSPEPRQ